MENLAPSSFVEKHFFVFSDGKVEGELPDNITFIPTEHKPWPAITLERFHTITLGLCLAIASQSMQFGPFLH